MRWVLVVCLLAACGRIGFDERALDGGDAQIAGRWLTGATSGEATCAITGTGELWCWGSGAYAVLGNGAVVVQPPRRVGTQSDWTAVTMGHVLTCGLRADRSLWCWGVSSRGAIAGAPVDSVVADPLRIGTGTWQAVTAAEAHACAIDDGGALSCWGEGDLGVLGNGSTTLTVPTPTRVTAVGTDRWTAVSTSRLSTCGIQTDGSLWCWGYNNDGQIGDGSQLQRNAPVQIGSGRTWTAVSTGAGHTCALEQGGQPWCWGNNFFGSLGNGARTSVAETSPVRASVLPPLASITVGRAHTCGRTQAGDVQCVGNAERGQFGIVLGLSAQPIAIAQATAGLFAGGDVTCVIDASAHLLCTGASAFAQAGGQAGIRLVPEQSDARTDWARIVAMANHACALTTTDALYCWGVNNFGELGNGMPQDVDVPVATNRTFSAVAIGTYGLGAIGADASLWYSGLHPDLTTTALAPMQFAGANTTKAVTAGDQHACRILVGDTVVCGGLNNHGQLGDNTTVNKVGASVAGTWKWIAAGPSSTCGITLAGQLMCWGRNEAGQLGIGGTSETVATPQPVTLPGATGAPAVVRLGYNFACALTVVGELYCWGAGDVGQLGVGSPTGSLTPLRVGTATDWRHIATGDAHACAIKQDNTLWCWGHNDGGQGGPALGDPTSPVQIAGADWLDVAAGTHFTCALKLDGTRWCIGNNNNGELGNDGGWREQFVVIP